MTATRVRLDLVCGRVVRDENGRRVGRIRDMTVVKQGEDLVVTEYHLGNRALLHRFGLSLLSVVGIRLGGEPARVPWNRLDLTDPVRPRFLGTAEELRR